MFCEKCGTQLPDNAEFCTNCGNSVTKLSNANEKINDTEVQLNVKPTFKFAYMVLPSLCLFTLIVIFFSLIFIGISPLASAIAFSFGFIVVVFIEFIKALIVKKQYDCYTYDFYKTKVIYRDSFLNISEKEVKYKFIIEATMRQSFIQRWFNLGNIVLFTNAETGLGNGIIITNVEDVNEKYKKIKEIINI